MNNTTSNDIESIIIEAPPYLIGFYSSEEARLADLKLWHYVFNDNLHFLLKDFNVEINSLDDFHRWSVTGPAEIIAYLKEQDGLLNNSEFYIVADEQTTEVVEYKNESKSNWLGAILCIVFVFGGVALLAWLLR